jgi:hypothetical protein
MHRRIHFISHQGKPILLADFSNCSAIEVEKIARAVPDLVTVQPLNSVLLLADFTGASIDREAIRTMKASAVFDKPFIKKSAWIGAEHFPTEFYDEIKGFSRRDMPIFGSRQEALTWLVAD